LVPEILGTGHDWHGGRFGFVQESLAAEAAKQAGDPGRVVLRWLSNAEYTFTVCDLTGLATLDPAREFPVDAAAGEGFTNTGQALVMSPALVTKYLDAAKGTYLGLQAHTPGIHACGELLATSNPTVGGHEGVTGRPLRRRVVGRRSPCRLRERRGLEPGAAPRRDAAAAGRRHGP